MFMYLSEITVNTGDHFVPVQMLAFGVLLLAAHLGGRLFYQLKLSESSGQLLGGVLAGPWLLHATGMLPETECVYDGAIGTFNFFVFIFISVVAFSIGEELHLNRLKTVGRSALIICLSEIVVTFALIAVGLHYVGNMSWIPSMMVASIGVVTAPAVTFVLLNRLRIEGRLRNILGSVEVLCDIIGVIIFAFLVQIAGRAAEGSDAAGSGVVAPVLKELLLAHLAGIGVFLALRLLVRRRRKPIVTHEEDTPEGLFHRLLAEHPSPSAQIFVVVVASVSVGAGAAYYFDLPFLISSAFAGFLVANFHSHAIFDSLKISNISSLFNLGFFAIVGSTIRFDHFDGQSAKLIAIYVVTRSLGKFVGTWLGCRIVNEDRKIASCLPFLMFPQAAVAAVEAVYASALLGDPSISTIILPSIILFEIGGTLMSDRSLRKWRTWVAGEEHAMQQNNAPSKPSDSLRLLLSILKPEHVMLELKGRSKDEVLSTMIEHAGKHAPGGINTLEIKQLIEERELLMPTGMGHGIAIPHCRLLDIKAPMMIWGRHKEGVIFGGVDDSPCHLIVMILSGAGDPNEHMRLLSATAHLLGNEEVRNTLLMARSEEDFMFSIRESTR